MSEKKTSLTNHSTRVDLGEDLLKDSEDFAPPVESVLNENNPKELLRSAKILKSEGLIAEAKKAFLKVLRFDPKNNQAKKLLEEIQEHEFKDLFAEESEQTSSFTFLEKPDPEEVLKQLEKDLNLDLSVEDYTQAEKIEVIENKLGSESFSMSHHYDLALLFYQLEHFSKSLEYLEKNIQKIPEDFPEKESDAMKRLASVELKAVILDDLGKYYELIQFLEKELAKEFIIDYERSHFFYLLAKSCYSTGRFQEAKRYIELISHVKTSFKDIKTLRKKILFSNSGAGKR